MSPPTHLRLTAPWGGHPEGAVLPVAQVDSDGAPCVRSTSGALRRPASDRYEFCPAPGSEAEREAEADALAFADEVDAPRGDALGVGARVRTPDGRVGEVVRVTASGDRLVRFGGPSVETCEVEAFAADALAAAPEPDHDPVERPVHYRGDGGLECIDAIRAALGREGFVAFLRGQVMKYTWRTGAKGPALEDARKAEWYQRRLVRELGS